jgi:preprotein translocase subunit YajC
MVSYIQGLLLVAQDAAPPAASGCGGDVFTQLGPLFLMLPIFYFLVIGPARRERKNHQTMLEALKRGDEIVTSSGIVGTISDFEDALVIVEISKGVKLRILKSAIANKYAVRKDAAKTDPKKEEAKA